MTDTERVTHVHVADIVLIRPGDRVLIAFKNELTREDADEIKSIMEERFPDADWTVAGGVSAIAELAARGERVAQSTPAPPDPSASPHSNNAAGSVNGTEW